MSQRIADNIRSLAHDALLTEPSEEACVGVIGFEAIAPTPNERPWSKPAIVDGLKGDKDRLIRERYEVTGCPTEPLHPCAEVWVTGHLGKSGELVCAGLRMEIAHGKFSNTWLPIRAISDCPLHRKKRFKLEKNLRAGENPVFISRPGVRLPETW